MKVVTSDQMREIDRQAIEVFNIPGQILMNNAGRSISDFIEREYPGAHVTVFCGRGNNGGDGFAAAYYLKNNGFNVTVYLAGSGDSLTETSSLFYRICLKIGIQVIEISQYQSITPEFNKVSVIIDALTGTGFTGNPGGILLQLIEIINSSGVDIISADIPSGLPSEGSVISKYIIKATVTITMGLPKIAMVTYPGAQFCGRVLVADIGFPSELTGSSKLNVSLADEKFIKEIPFTLHGDSHKGTRGHSLIVGGFPGMEGAAILTASAHFETGAGLVTIMTHPESRSIIAGKIPECMTGSLPEKPDIPDIEAVLKKGRYTTLVMGPGMGRDVYGEIIFSVIMDILPQTGIRRALIDGDGLYFLSEYIKEKNLPEDIEFLITPHFMEASRILSIDIEKLKEDRFKTAHDLFVKTGAVSLLKGPASVISDRSGSYINTSGNSSLATAGSGDVLSGIVASLMNLDIPLIKAGAAAMYIHGLCSDIYSSGNPGFSMKSGDIVNYIKRAISYSVSGEW